jgi:hypothetical protein
VTNIPGLNGESIRQLEAASIGQFILERRHLLRGRVLDFGCGTSDTCRDPQPFKRVVESSGAQYYGYDPALGHNPEVWLKGPYDTIVCTQVLHMVKRPLETLARLKWATLTGGHLLMTYPTCWTTSVETNDYWRFTPQGMAELLESAGWRLIESVPRGLIDIPDWPIQLGHGVVAKCEVE